MRSVRRRVWARHGGAAVAVAFLAWFFGGMVGVLAAAVGLVVAATLGPRWVGAGAFGSLVIAAFATVLEVEPSDSYGVTFARDRPVASNSALVAGVLTLVALVTFALREREKRVRGSARAGIAPGE